MFSGWLTNDEFIWKELTKTVLSVTVSLSLILLGRTILLRRDREIKELDRSRDKFDELREEFIEIDNEYYKVRKRYTTVRDAFAVRPKRNPYIVKVPTNREEVMDGLLVTCIELEGRYYTLRERLKVSFSDFWKKDLVSLMDRQNKTNPTSIESYFDKIRDCIEDNVDIDDSLKESISSKFEEILKAFDSYEPNLLPQHNLWGKRIKDFWQKRVN